MITAPFSEIPLIKCFVSRNEIPRYYCYYLLNHGANVDYERQMRLAYGLLKQAGHFVSRRVDRESLYHREVIHSGTDYRCGPGLFAITNSIRKDATEA